MNPKEGEKFFLVKLTKIIAGISSVEENMKIFGIE